LNPVVAGIILGSFHTIYFEIAPDATGREKIGKTGTGTVFEGLRAGYF
jgi:hypothetical protein